MPAQDALEMWKLVAARRIQRAPYQTINPRRPQLHRALSSGCTRIVGPAAGLKEAICSETGI